MNLCSFVLSTLAALVMVQAEVNYIEHDIVKPFTQPVPITDSDKAAVKYKPQLLVSYDCQPYPMVQADGSVSAGLKGTGPIDGECGGSDLGSQRHHFWEIAVVWIDDPSLATSTILGLSLNYGDAFASKAPVEAEYLDDLSMKLESFRGFTAPRPKLRLTTEAGETQDLITWEQLTAEACEAAGFNTALTEKVDMPLKDGVFEKILKDTWPF